MTTLFASDIHLSPQRPDITEAFLNFLNTKGAAAKRLYLLGDIFEYWLGDDVSMADFPEVCSALKTLSRRGVEIFIQVGNRDFALGKQFCRDTGCKMLSDPSVIEVNGHAAIIGHGDDLCTDDIDYLRLRRILRNRVFLGIATRFPANWRRHIAEGIRQKSSQAQAYKATAIMDVNQAAVNQRFEQLRASIMIHGHTHRPKHHQLASQNGNQHRIVLGDWYQQGSYLEISESEINPAKWTLQSCAPK